MDSLLANYASSDDDDVQPPKPRPSLFSALPPPKTLASSSPSLFSSLPRGEKANVFSPFPRPKSEPSNPRNPKRVVQFTLPLNPSLLKPNDDDDDDDEAGERKPIEDSSSSAPSKGLSSMLPAPKHSLCLAPSAASRRSIFETGVSSSNTESVEKKQESSNFDGYRGSKDESFRSEEHYASYEGNLAANEFGVTSYETSYASEGGDYGAGYASNWSDGNSTAMAAPMAVPEMERFAGKRGRNEIPTEIVEVNQAELMKNRPRADQAKVTGIAFGPAYQPVSTSKGKPSKLHKRKHQIGSLYFDMKQKEMELAERRAKGFLTKAETQAKYGW
ncbi:proline-rich protein PRCC [Asparagus officinalis]|uniref:proline-rich protein PRCC n=1 Tax=Asparagus officinalis TaxID=4686 RepID=UPI00098E7407|nr:proline-rich protein PRCC [Asparagus officinalis]